MGTSENLAAVVGRGEIGKKREYSGSNGSEVLLPTKAITLGNLIFSARGFFDHDRLS